MRFKIALVHYHSFRVIQGAIFFLLLGLGGSLKTTAQDPALPPALDGSGTITNLLQLSASLSSTNIHLYRDISLDVLVCAASRPEVGVFIVQDPTTFDVLELGVGKDRILPGDRIRIEGRGCLLRRRDFGIEISRAPVVDNDGLHARTNTVEVTLKAGLVPLRLDWFNCLRFSRLDVSCRGPGGRKLDMTRSMFYRPDSLDGTHLLPGLRATCYEAEGEGYWEDVPNFRLYSPTKTGVTTNFDVDFSTRDEMIGIRFTGYFDAPASGAYQFQVESDDGSLLFLGDPEVAIIRLGSATVPAARPGTLDEPLSDWQEQPWLSVEGRVGFAAKVGQGLKFELRSERNSIWVKLADASGLDSTRLLNSYVRVTGVGNGILTTDGRLVLGRLAAAGTNELTVLEQMPGERKLSPILDTALQVQSLPLDDIKRGLPVRIRGVVTSICPPVQHWVSLQDDERGIFVQYSSVPNIAPALGQLWEVTGHTAPGQFAPIIIADGMHFLGPGRMPEPPVRPTWNELNNGAMDAQWVELEGLVTGIQTNTLTLLLPEGHLDVVMNDYYLSDLKKFQNAVVRIRGVLFAVWGAATRQVQVGRVLMRNATVSMDLPAPTDPFEAPAKTPAQLFLFDAQATAFQRVKIRGQVIRVEPKRIFLMDRGAGLQILLAKTETASVSPGDIIEAVGYPDISGASPLLRESIVRRVGSSALPAATPLPEDRLPNASLDLTRVKVEGTLMDWYLDPGVMVLEMRSGSQLYFAKVSLPSGPWKLPQRAGSRLALTGVYVGHTESPRETEVESFDVLVNSPADIAVLSKPSWWTLQQLLIVVGMLSIVLTFSLLWITQLRRQVEQRTSQLQHETRERERVERQHAIETERSRIARDLHDDLGSGLTEIGVLANTGQRSDADNGGGTPLFGTIASKAKNLITALDVLVWAVDPAANSLQSLADYLSGYADEFFAHTRIHCRFKIPVSFPPITLDGRIRHELFMSVKEALNNVVRHAEATEVEFHMAAADDLLNIVIVDNGKGFDPESGREGHGRENLSGRLEELGGTCIIESRPGGGTTVKIHLPLSAGDVVKPDGARGANTTND